MQLDQQAFQLVSMSIDTEGGQFECVQIDTVPPCFEFFLTEEENQIVGFAVFPKRKNPDSSFNRRRIFRINQSPNYEFETVVSFTSWWP